MRGCCVAVGTSHVHHEREVLSRKNVGCIVRHSSRRKVRSTATVTRPTIFLPSQPQFAHVADDAVPSNKNLHWATQHGCSFHERGSAVLCRVAQVMSRQTTYRCIHRLTCSKLRAVLRGTWKAVRNPLQHDMRRVRIQP